MVAQSQMGRKRLEAGWRVSARLSLWRCDSGHLMLVPPGVCLGTEHSLSLQSSWLVIPASPEGTYSQLLFWGQFQFYSLSVLPLLLTLLLMAQGRGINLLLTPPPHPQQAGGARGGPFLSCTLLSPQHSQCTGTRLDEVGSDSWLGSCYAANCSQHLHLVAFVSRHSCVPGTALSVKQGFAGCLGIIFIV